MKVWAVANQKGGVGKTTTVVSLAGLCTLKGERTLIVDLDPHGSLTAYFQLDPERIEHSVYDLFAGSVPAQSILCETGVERLVLLPAAIALATLDRQIGARAGMGLVLRRALQEISERFDRVLLDCPPMLGVLMINALAASHHVIIPVQTEFLALKGLQRMVHTLAMMQRSRAHTLLYSVVPTQYDRRTRASVEALEELRRCYRQQLWDGVIPVDTQFREASKRGSPLTVLRPWARGSRAYRQLLGALEAAPPIPPMQAVNHG